MLGAVGSEGRGYSRSRGWSPEGAFRGSPRFPHIYVNDAGDAAVAEAEIEILTDPPVRLRVADRFRVDDDGRIVDQVNYFDPRDVTNPGWRTSS